jgi:L-arabinose isomerase
MVPAERVRDDHHNVGTINHHLSPYYRVVQLHSPSFAEIVYQISRDWRTLDQAAHGVKGFGTIFRQLDNISKD